MDNFNLSPFSLRPHTIATNYWSGRNMTSLSSPSDEGSNVPSCTLQSESPNQADWVPPEPPAELFSESPVLCDSYRTSTPNIEPPNSPLEPFYRSFSHLKTLEKKLKSFQGHFEEHGAKRRRTEINTAVSNWLTEQPRRFECHHCGKLLTTRRSLEFHIRCFHLRILELYTCDLCPFQTPWTQGLLSHKRMRHGGGAIDDANVDPFCSEGRTCQPCNRFYATQRSFRRHWNHVHSIRKFNCESCDKSYASEKTLRRHKRSHEELDGEKKRRRIVAVSFVCEGCWKGYKYETMFLKHRQVCQASAGSGN